MNRAVLFFLLMGLSSASSAQAWVPFANCGGGEQLRSYSYDRSSVVTQGASRVVSIRGDYSQVRGSPTMDGRIVWTLDCAGRTYVEQSRTEFRADGSVHVKYDTATRPMGISPGSVADKLSQQVCISG